MYTLFRSIEASFQGLYLGQLEISGKGRQFWTKRPVWPQEILIQRKKNYKREKQKKRKKNKLKPKDRDTHLNNEDSLDIELPEGVMKWKSTKILARLNQTPKPRIIYAFWFSEWAEPTSQCNYFKRQNFVQLLFLL